LIIWFPKLNYPFSNQPVRAKAMDGVIYPQASSLYVQEKIRSQRLNKLFTPGTALARTGR